jgi:hypothetical protein
MCFKRMVIIFDPLIINDRFENLKKFKGEKGLGCIIIKQQII